MCTVCKYSNIHTYTTVGGVLLACIKLSPRAHLKQRHYTVERFVVLRLLVLISSVPADANPRVKGRSALLIMVKLTITLIKVVIVMVNILVLWKWIYFCEWGEVLVAAKNCHQCLSAYAKICTFILGNSGVWLCCTCKLRTLSFNDAKTYRKTVLQRRGFRTLSQQHVRYLPTLKFRRWQHKREGLGRMRDVGGGQISWRLNHLVYLDHRDSYGPTVMALL